MTEMAHPIRFHILSLYWLLFLATFLIARAKPEKYIETLCSFEALLLVLSLTSGVYSFNKQR